MSFSFCNEFRRIIITTVGGRGEGAGSRDRRGVNATKREKRGGRKGEASWPAGEPASAYVGGPGWKRESQRQSANDS